MSRGDDDSEYDLRRLGSALPSGAVTGVGIISIMLGCLDLLLGLCSLLLSAGEENLENVRRVGLPAFGVMVSILILLWGTLALIVGIGVIKRRQWARIMLLVWNGIRAAVVLVFLTKTFSLDGAGLDPLGNRSAFFMGLVIVLYPAIILIGYCVLSYVVLLNNRNRAEFRQFADGEAN